MILSDREILAAIERGSFKISPQPDPASWSSTAVDLRLDGELRQWTKIEEHGISANIDPADSKFNFSSLAAKHTKTIDISADGFVLKPQGFVLGWTIEKIQLPYRSRIAARVEGKSSLARLGLGVHITAPTIHAGFGFDEKHAESEGNAIQLEIFNLGNIAIRLTKGMRVCQLIFEEVHGTPDKGYAGMFAKQGVAILK